MKQLPSNSKQENSESSSELKAEVEQLSDIASNLAIDSEIQAKIQSLLAHIKTSLQQQQLSTEMQRELARLLSLISTLDYGNPQQIEILDLAISTLLENKEDTTKNFKNSKLQNKASHRNSGNLVFIQEIRRQIVLQSQEFPNPVSAIIKGRGGAYNRLISGLSWFFLIFVLCPIFGVGLTFVGLSFGGDTEEIASNQRIVKLQAEVDNKDREIQNVNEISNALRSRLTKVNDQLKSFYSEEDINNEKISIELDRISQLQTQIEEELETATKKESRDEKEVQTTVADGNITTNATRINEGITQASQQNNQVITFTDWFVKQDLFFISLAISMGALGSAVSVIVRANKFIEQSQERQSDLFFTGFLRPFVGMSFAIFAVALIESGVFSGIFTIAKSENRNVYLYMAIAFIAGFSERLVEDVVLRTEDTLTGYSSRSNKIER